MIWLRRQEKLDCSHNCNDDDTDDDNDYTDNDSRYLSYQTSWLKNIHVWDEKISLDESKGVLRAYIM